MTPYQITDSHDAALLFGKTNSYHRNINRAFGVCNGIFICQFMYLDGKQWDKEGWIYKKYSEITEETGLTEREIDTARRKLKDLGILTEKRKGTPPILYFKFDWKRVTSFLAEWREKQHARQLAQNVLIENKRQKAALQQYETSSFNSTKRPNQSGQNVPDITKNTPEITNINNSNKVGVISADAKINPSRVLCSGEMREPEVENQPLESILEHEHTKAPQPPAAISYFDEELGCERLAGNWIETALDTVSLANEVLAPADHIADVSKMIPETPPKTVKNTEVARSINQKEKTPPRTRQTAKTAFYYANGEPFNVENCHTNFVNLFSGWKKSKGLSKTTPNLTEFRRLLTCDGRTPDHIRAVYEYLKERGLAVNGDGRFLVEVEGIKSLRKDFEKIEKHMSQRKGLKPLAKAPKIDPKDQAARDLEEYNKRLSNVRL